MIAALFLETLSRLLLPFASGTPVQAATVLGLSQALLGLTVPLWTVSSASSGTAAPPYSALVSRRTVTPPGEIDPLPNGKILDKGCGVKKPDKTLGLPNLVDVFVKP